MKLLYVVHQFYPRYITGTEQYVLGLAREAVREGHDVEVFTLEPDYLMDWPGFKAWSDSFEGLRVHRFSVGNVLFANPVLAEFDNPVVGRHFEERLASSAPDVVHFFHTRYLGSNLIGMTRALGYATVVNLMDFWFLCPHVTLLKPDGGLCGGPTSEGADCLRCAYPDLTRMVRDGRGPDLRGVPSYTPGLLRHTDGLGDLYTAAARRTEHLREAFSQAHAVIAPSQFLADRYEANGFHNDGMTVMRYGVDMGRLAGLDWRADSGGLRVGYIGTVSNHKGLHTAVEAFLGLEGDGHTLQIHGRLEDYPDYSADRQFQAKDDPRVEFRGGFEQSKLGEVLSGIDVLVVPSLWYENTPFVVLEALAAKIPVVASRLGGMTEAFREGETGYSFAPGDAAELRGILSGLAEDASRVETMRGAMDPPRTLDDNWRELHALYGDVMNEASSESPTDGSSEGRVERLERELAIREKQVRDLYDQLMSLAARFIREKNDEAPS